MFDGFEETKSQRQPKLGINLHIQFLFLNKVSFFLTESESSQFNLIESIMLLGAKSHPVSSVRGIKVRERRFFLAAF